MPFWCRFDGPGWTASVGDTCRRHRQRPLLRLLRDLVQVGLLRARPTSLNLELTLRLGKRQPRGREVTTCRAFRSTYSVGRSGVSRRAQEGIEVQRLQFYLSRDHKLLQAVSIPTRPVGGLYGDGYPSGSVRRLARPNPHGHEGPEGGLALNCVASDSYRSRRSTVLVTNG